MKETKIFGSLFQHRFLILFFYLFISNINISLCGKCGKDTLITDNTCFNDILRFDSKPYRAGHFATYKNGDIIVEFSDDGIGDTYGYSRIFYGLKKDGRYYFSNNCPTYEIPNIGNVDDARGRYESLNQIVVTEDDLERNKEYLFSTSSYNSLTELHNIENRDYIYNKTKTFMGKLIFSFQYSMVEAQKNDKIFYFVGFTYGSNSEDNGDRLDIKKIGFKSFNLNDYHHYKTITINYNRNNRILNLFVIKNFEILVLTYITNNKYLKFKFYDYNLDAKGSEYDFGVLTFTDDGQTNPPHRDGVFFKSVELPENRRAITFYYNGNGEYLYFKIFKFNKNSDNTCSTNEILGTRTPGDYWFSSYVTFNDIYKIRDDRIAFATVSTNYKTLVLLMFDLYNSYQNLKTRWYYFNIDSINLKKELSIYAFNDYLMLTMTGKDFSNLLIFDTLMGQIQKQIFHHI